MGERRGAGVSLLQHGGQGRRWSRDVACEERRSEKLGFARVSDFDTTLLLVAGSTVAYTGRGVLKIVKRSFSRRTLPRVW